MSCVVALQHDGKLYMGSDGVSVNTSGETRPVICQKMFWNGPYLIGFTGSIRTGQVLHPNHFKPPKDIKNFPDAAYDQFADKGTLGQDEDGSSAHQCNFLIGFEGRLYDILTDFQMNESSGGYNAIGIGAMAALGSFFTSKKIRSPEKRILTALKAAAEFSFAVGPPYTIEVMES